MRLAPCPVGPFHFTFSPSPPKSTVREPEGTASRAEADPSGGRDWGVPLSAPGLLWRGSRSTVGRRDAKHGDGLGSGSAAAREKWEPEPSEREKEAAQALEPPPHTQWGREDEGEEAAA